MEAAPGEAIPVAPESSSIPCAALRASLSAVCRIWKNMGPDFRLEQMLDEEVEEGDVILTVIFHLKETPLEAPIYDALNRQQKQTEEDARHHKRDRLEATLDYIAPGDERDDSEEEEEADEDEEEFDDEDSSGRLSIPDLGTTPPQVTMSDAPKFKPRRPVRQLAPPQLCVSFLISVADVQPERRSLLKFDEDDDGDNGESGRMVRPVCLEVFGDGLDAAEGKGFRWRLVEESEMTKEKSPLQSLKIVSASSFRHRFINIEESEEWIFDRKQVLERCRILSSIDMPFPEELLARNMDYFANFVLLGIVLPETVSEELADAVETRGLCQRAMLVETYEKTGKLKPIKLQKMVSSALDFSRHHLVCLGHIEHIVEASFLVGGSSTDAMYDPQNLARNAKKAGPLTKAALAGAVVGGAVGVLIPIPGLFFAVSAAGSVGAKWVAGKFINSDGEELANVVPVASVRSEIDVPDVLDAVQDFDEDAPEWKQYLNKLPFMKARKAQSEMPLSQAEGNLIDPDLPEQSKNGEKPTGVQEPLSNDSYASSEEGIARSWSRNILGMFSSSSAPSKAAPVSRPSEPVNAPERSSNPMFTVDSGSWTRQLWDRFSPSEEREAPPVAAPQSPVNVDSAEQQAVSTKPSAVVMGGEDLLKVAVSEPVGSNSDLLMFDIDDSSSASQHGPLDSAEQEESQADLLLFNLN